MKVRHIIIIGVFILINVLVISTLNFGGKEEETSEGPGVFVKTLEAIEVNNASESFQVSGYGTVTSYQSVDISAEVQGKMLKGSKTLKPGVKYRKGETIFSIKDTDSRYNIRSRKSGFINIIAQMLPDIKVDFPSEFDKWNNYVNSIKLNEALPILPSWKSSKEKIFISTRNVLTEYFAIKSLEEQLKKYVVRAPFSGVVTQVFVNDHSIVNPGTRILTLSQTDDYEIPVSIPVGSLEKIEIGTSCNIYTTNGTLKSSGKVVRISEVINKTTQSVDVYVEPSDNDSFINGEYVRVAVNETGEFTGTRLPLDAVSEGSVFIYAKSDSTLSRRMVEVLDENENGLFVSGLKNKEIVIIQEVLNHTDTTKYGILIKQ